MQYFRITLLILAIVPLITGVVDLLLGAQAINTLGPALSVESLENATLNSQLRFFAAIWLGYGAGLIIVAMDVEKHVVLFRLLAIFLFLSGIGRLASIVQFGMPAPPLVVATGIELVFIPILYIWHTRLVQFQSRP